MRNVQKSKRGCMIFLSVVLLLIPLTAGVSAQPAIQIEIDGQPLVTDVSPVIEDGRTLVPVAHLLRALGAEVNWDGDSRTVTITQDDTTILLTIDSQTALINGQATQMQVPARILNSRTLVPLRFVAENLEANVEWDGVNRMVRVTTGEPDFVLRRIEFETVDPGALPDDLAAWVEENRLNQGIHSRPEGDWIYAMASGGERPTGGYIMKVLTVSEVQPGEVYVEAELEIPGIEEMVTMALTYPSEIIRFDGTGINTVTGQIRELRRGLQEVTLYFMRETDTAFLTEGETRTFQSKDVTPEDVLTVLLAGPESASLKRIIPREVKLLGITVEAGLATVDFSQELADVNLGAEAEGVLVNSIVWTLVQLQEIDRVQIVVEGEVIESLAGHVSIDQPLTR
ncbi:MAG: stalk domain-containing protein [Bacillota bacterium]|nr:stalk domain-containing protein [Bacillota bacterium]MDW7678160.1 stalk domain-containing protein [Bacillota bacterium]